MLVKQLQKRALFEVRSTEFARFGLNFTIDE